MATEDAPQEIVDLAEARADARRAHDWATADELLARIAAAGWKVVDAASLYTLERAAPPDEDAGGTVRYGSSASVPSRLDAAPVGRASVVLVATDWPDDLARTLRALVDRSPDGTQLVVVANAPSPPQAAALAGLDAADPGAPGIVTEVVWTSARLGAAAALNVGVRRAMAPVVILLDTGLEPAGDLVSAIATALEDETVGVAGPLGLLSADLRRFDPAPDGVTEVDAIEGYALGFRRRDYAVRGPLDERFTFYRNLDIWWSLVLRDQYEDLPELDEDAEVDLAAIPAPRRAVRIESVPLIRHEHRAWSSVPADERERLSKKNFYRVLKRFATRRDLLVSGTPPDR